MHCRVYEIFDDGSWNVAKENQINDVEGATYWICMEERREDNDPNGAVTINGWLMNEDQTNTISTIEFTDNNPIAVSTEYRGFGAYWQPNSGGKILEWHVEPVPGAEPETPKAPVLISVE